MSLEELSKIMVYGFLTSFAFGVVVDLLVYGAMKALHLVKL